MTNITRTFKNWTVHTTIIQPADRLITAFRTVAFPISEPKATRYIVVVREYPTLLVESEIAAVLDDMDAEVETQIERVDATGEWPTFQSFGFSG